MGDIKIPLSIEAEVDLLSGDIKIKLMNGHDILSTSTIYSYQLMRAIYNEVEASPKGMAIFFRGPTWR